MLKNETPDIFFSSAEEINKAVEEILSHINYHTKNEKVIFDTPTEELFYLATNGFSIEDTRLFQLINPDEDISLIRQGIFSDRSQIDINTTDEYGNTLLHYLGAMHHCCLLGAYLLHKGANANCVNHFGETPLKRHAYHLNAFAVPLIEVTHQDNLHKIYADGETVLTDFAQNGCPCQLTDIIFTFHQQHVNINQTNTAGHTPLYYIIQRLNACPLQTRNYDLLSVTCQDLVCFGARLNDTDLSVLTNRMVVFQNKSVQNFITYSLSKQKGQE